MNMMECPVLLVMICGWMPLELGSPVVHKEAVDRELAKRADKERAKRERAAKKASKEA